MKKKYICLWMSVFFPFLKADDSTTLFESLEIVEKVEETLQDRLPFLYNGLLQGGYFTMPSARMNEAGTVGLGFSLLPPYHIYSANIQLLDRLELSGNYWVFHHLSDGVMGKHGFGDQADRAANLRIALLKRQEGYPRLPEIVFGWNDFLGTKHFESLYLVATYEFLPLNLETSLGFGKGRINGLFGGIAYFPFRHGSSWIRELSFLMEYDANRYRKHPHEHPRGRNSKTPINVGIHFSYLDQFHFTISSLRGNSIGASVGLTYNFGKSQGFLLKTKDPPLEMFSRLYGTSLEEGSNEEELFAQELAYAFRDQGFELYSAWETREFEKKHLYLKIVNTQYREEKIVRKRLQNLLKWRIPEAFYTVTVVVEVDGLAAQEYLFREEDLQNFRQKKVSEEELEVLSPLKEVSSSPCFWESLCLYQRPKKLCLLTLKPRYVSYFGSSTGKYKYDMGATGGAEGYLFDLLFYEVQLTYIAKSSTAGMRDFDLLNPSRIINVRSDSIRYVQTGSFHLEDAYVQLSRNLGCGWFGRVSCGYYELAYAGVTGEILYYPINSFFAIGGEISPLLKRKYFGMGVTHKIRKLEENTFRKVSYRGLQYFLNLYYDLKPANLIFKVSAGQFLAKDKGARFEVCRYFPSGFEFSLWLTLTNGGDRINGKRYYDKGFSFSLPLDFFLSKSSRSRLGYAMSAWLRDVGAQARTGKPLYQTLRREREF